MYVHILYIQLQGLKQNFEVTESPAQTRQSTTSEDPFPNTQNFEEIILESSVRTKQNTERSFSEVNLQTVENDNIGFSEASDPIPEDIQVLTSEALVQTNSKNTETVLFLPGRILYLTLKADNIEG